MSTLHANGHTAATSGEPSKLKLDRISKSFDGGDVLSDISLSVGDGEFVSMIGPSGCGKSTLFHLIGGLLTPDSGHIRLGGQEITGRKGFISYMPQDSALFPWRTIEDNVILAQEVAGISVGEAKRSAREWLTKVGLAGYEKKYPHVLSGGMKQRVAFLRAMLSPQHLMCLDEPFSALDELTRIDMQQWLIRIWEQNRRSVLFITHSVEEAILLSDRIYILSSKPTTVVREISVPFPRPRDPAITTDIQFVRLRQEIYEQMKHPR